MSWTGQELEALCEGVETILSPRDALGAALERVGPEVRHAIIGASLSGEPLHLFTLGAGSRSVLLYGFPDPGEAVGATAMTVLMRRWLEGAPRLRALDVTWLCIPVLNPDDQPGSGEELLVVRKSAAQEVDWWSDAPRPEAEALMALADRARPALTFPLHDEFHARDPIPAYFPVSEVLPAALTARLRAVLQTCGHPVEETLRHPSMGAGFALMSELAGEEAYARSTFRHLASHGPVVICETAAHPGLSQRALVSCALGVILESVETLQPR